MNSIQQDVLGNTYWINPNGSISANIASEDVTTVLGSLKTAVAMTVSFSGTVVAITSSHAMVSTSLSEISAGWNASY